LALAVTGCLASLFLAEGVLLPLVVASTLLAALALVWTGTGSSMISSAASTMSKIC